MSSTEFPSASSQEIVIAETEYRGEVEVITAPLRGLGLGIFLITVGMSVDLGWCSPIGGHPRALGAVLVVKAAVTATLLGLPAAGPASRPRPAC